MKTKSIITGFIRVLFQIAFVSAAPAHPPAVTSLATPVAVENLDPAAFVQWVDGSEKPITGDRGNMRQPETALWTSTFHFLWPDLKYGDSRNPGIRYVRIGFKNPVVVGSVIAHGGGALSALKPTAPYPGNLADDSQWIPAQRLINGHVVTDEAGMDDMVLWVLPSATPVRALRFAHVSKPSDNNYAGLFRGAYVLSARLVNLSPQAIAGARSFSQNATRMNNEKDDGWNSWNNIAPIEGERPKTILEDPEWVSLTWPSPVTLDGLALSGAGFSGADVQVYAGPVDKHPSQAVEGDWKTIRSVTGLKSLYPGILPVQCVEFDHPVTARAIRLRITAALDEKEVHPHLTGKTNRGKRVWLDEIFALKSLGSSSLAGAVLPTPTVNRHPPIAIKFTLPDDGLVTLVIEDSAGKRIRNLVAETPFSKGANTVYWDGTDDIGRDVDAANHGLYNIPARLIAPGTYNVRGLWHRRIDLRYEFSIYSPGNPPWPTQDTTGGWMTNHTPASAALFVPAGTAPGGIPMMLVGAYVSEGGSALSWLDLDGNKLGGRGWIGGNWTGAQYLAYDSGTNSIPGTYAYVGAAWKNEDKPKPGEKAKGVIRLTGLSALSASGDKPVLDPVYTFEMPDKGDPASMLGGIAVHNGLLVFSQPALGQLVFVDIRKRNVIGTVPLPEPHGVVFDSQGRLLALSASALLRFAPGDNALPPGPPEVLVNGLEHPAGITVDGKGSVYVSEQGNSNQVKVLSTTGEFVRAYGKAGPMVDGAYDPNHLNNPKGLALDSNGRLWVAEENFRPKRASVWNPDGTLWKAFYGPAQYGGGGTFDSKDPTCFFYDGMEFRVDWDKGEARLARIYYRDDPDILKGVERMAPPEYPLHFNGRRYMSNAYNTSPTDGTDIAFLFMDQGDRVVPVAAMGAAKSWALLKNDEFKPLWPANGGLDNATFIWSDLNGDGRVEPGEIQMWAGRCGGVTISQDGSFLVANMAGPGSETGHATRFKPLEFTPGGVPVYGARKGETLADSQTQESDGGGQVLLGTDGWTVTTTAPPPFSKFGIGGARNGVAMWSYPSLWPGLHPSHSSPAPSFPGELIGTTRLLGDLVTPRNSDAGPLFFLNSNQGDIYVFTQDGLFVTQLFQDVRQGQLWEMPRAGRGMVLNHLTLHDENFFPTVAQLPDGRICVNSGALSAMVGVEGLESIRRITPIPLTVTSSTLELARKFVTEREATRQAAQGTGILTVPLLKQAPGFDSSELTWVSIDQRGVAAYFDSHSKPYEIEAAAAIAEGKLIALWKTGDPQLLKNSGEIANAPFKTGGALDLMIGADPGAKPHRVQPSPGDMRLLVTQANGKTKALLYRAVVPGTHEKQRTVFSAPWHSVSFDSVMDVSDQVELISDGKGNFEINVPLALLMLAPKDGVRIDADIGILRGNGTETTQRVYWNNKATAIVSDVPSEAMLTPALWGIWEFHGR